MDSDALDTFLAVHRRGGISNAAKFLHRSQPAISRRIALLEQELGVPLFERAAGRTLLSDAGRVLVPYAERVRTRFDAWLTEQESQGRAFTEDQREWLVAIRDHVAANLEIEIEDLEFVPFNTLGGPARALKVFGPELRAVLTELNEVLAA